MICLDTNAVIAAINQRKPGVRRRLEPALVDGVIIGIPAVVLYEVWYTASGKVRGPRPMRRCWPPF
jgi:tRNA(fMet)-specific endonuclease VapC